MPQRLRRARAAGELDARSLAAAGERHFLCAIEPMTADLAGVVEGYKALGYRLMRREPMMVRTVRDVDPVTGPLPIVRVRDMELAGRTSVVAGHRLLVLVVPMVRV